MAVLKAPPIAPLEPQECVVPELFWVLSIDAIPAPGDADAVTLDVVGAGDVVLNPDGNAQVASDNPQTAVGAGGAVLTVSESLALFPVSRVPTKRFVDVLLYVPTIGTVTLTDTVQVPAAASAPPVRRMPGSLADSAPPALSVNVPPQVFVVVRGEATTIAPGLVGSVSVKLRPVCVTGVGFVNVKVSVEMPPTLVGSGLKFFDIVTAEGSRI